MKKSDFIIDDRDIIPAKCFAEDKNLRNIGGYPEYVGTMIICIDSFDNSLARGRLYNYFCETPLPFYSLDQLLFAMEDVMDKTSIPQAWTKKRTFSKGKSTQIKKEPKDSACQNGFPFYDLQTMRPKRGRLVSFYVRVYSRMHASMQGVVMSYGSSEKMAFRSGLEFLYLIREKLS